MKIVVGAVAELYRGDYDIGRHLTERLAGEDLGPNVHVEDLHYGAVAFAQYLQDARPDALVLVGAVERGRPPGTVVRIRARRNRPPPEQARTWIEAAATGHVTLDLAIDVPAALDALPARTVVIEVEPASAEPSERLSPEAVAALEHVVRLVRSEVARLPLFDLADQVQDLVTEERLEPSPALAAVRELVHELGMLEEEGRWGLTFALRDRLRAHIGMGNTGDGMQSIDWVMWWTLIEALDRVQAQESTI